ncbi:MAG TPA: PQQ-dependent sugar dehydrogenase [Jatrophihabitans sp.]|nr:PQQ-dependent sugar dehydrogenase [Jatrophihabitans sp.]
MLRLRVLPRPRSVLIAAAACLALAGCGGASGSTGTFSPQPDFLGNNDPNPQLPNPGMPQPSLPGSVPPGGTVPSGGPSSAPGAQTAAGVVATKLAEPTGLVVLPDGTALVGERRTGKIFRVYPDGSTPATVVQTLAGVDGTGDGGLLDLAISPSYDEDGLIYAYLTTATDNRVVHFPLGSAPSTVIGGIPKGRTGNTGRIAFDATGALLTGTGDAGNPALAAAPGSLAGKVLRTDDIGKPLPENPDPASPVYARGLTGLTGLCVDPTSGTRLAVAGDRIEVLTAGTDYAARAPAGRLPATLAGGGGCALAGNRLLVATADGQALATGTLSNGTIPTLAPTLVRTYGRLRTVVLGADGAVWLTTRNRDGHGSPVPDDDRVIRLTSTDSASSVV